MKTRTVTIVTEFTAEIPADMSHEEAQDLAIEVALTKVKLRTFACPPHKLGAKVTSFTTTAVIDEPAE